MLCDRAKEPASDYCNFHRAAEANLDNVYSVWKRAYGGNMTDEEYFDRLERLAETGSAAKELIRHRRNRRAVA